MVDFQLSFDLLFLLDYSLGSDSHIIELVQHRKPDPPRSLVVKQLDYKTVRLKVGIASAKLGTVNKKKQLTTIPSD